MLGCKIIMEIKKFGIADTKLVSLSKNFKINLSKSEIRLTKKDAQEFDSEFIYIIHNWNDLKNLPFFRLKLKYAIWLILLFLLFLVWLIVLLKLLYYLLFC